MSQLLGNVCTTCGTTCRCYSDGLFQNVLDHFVRICPYGHKAFAATTEQLCLFCGMPKEAHESAPKGVGLST